MLDTKPHEISRAEGADVCNCRQFVCVGGRKKSVAECGGGGRFRQLQTRGSLGSLRPYSTLLAPQKFRSGTTNTCICIVCATGMIMLYDRSFWRVKTSLLRKAGPPCGLDVVTRSSIHTLVRVCLSFATIDYGTYRPAEEQAGSVYNLDLGSIPRLLNNERWILGSFRVQGITGSINAASSSEHPTILV